MNVLEKREPIYIAVFRYPKTEFKISTAWSDAWNRKRIVRFGSTTIPSFLRNSCSILAHPIQLRRSNKFISPTM